MRRISLLSTFLVALVLAAFQYPLVHAATVHPSETAQAAPASTSSALPPDYVGSEMCETCHADIAHTFDDNPHTKMVLMHGDNDLTCENCHGPGQAHVEGGGDVTKIFRFEKSSPKQIDDKCLACHATAHPNFLRSPHASASLSCISCHSVHHATTRTNLLLASQPTLCESCHTDVKAQFGMPFHHPLPEGVIKCTDCHDPHGTFQGTQLRSTVDQNAVCTRCHSETAGPFVYEHPVVKTEGCLACHSPHGSPNPRLLNVSNVNTLCMQCHSASMNFGPLGTPSFHNQAAQYQSCTNCHTQIHGSNTSSVFFH